MAMRKTCLALMAGAFIANSATASAEEKTSITVFKTPWCGCCEAWSEALEKAGYNTVTRDMEDLTGIKKQAGVGDDLAACHTAVLDTERKYVLEGHVPLEAIEKLMSESPDIRGIAVPGMPQGSLGMGDQQGATYDVIAFGGKDDEKAGVYYRAGQ